MMAKVFLTLSIVSSGDTGLVRQADTALQRAYVAKLR